MPDKTRCQRCGDLFPYRGEKPELCSLCRWNTDHKVRKGWILYAAAILAVVGVIFGLLFFVTHAHG